MMSVTLTNPESSTIPTNIESPLLTRSSKILAIFLGLVLGLTRSSNCI